MRADKLSDYKGHQILIANTGRGVYNGYVSVPEGHPMHGVDYSDNGFWNDLHCCNGGVTFTGELSYKEATGDWYIGFDNSHAYDMGCEKLFEEYGRNEGGYLHKGFSEHATFKTLEMTEVDCKAIIDVLVGHQL